ncbi:hypothetical protein B0H19DRAFT_1256481 [Mycena capillaripes]|nr:hypothetical protein B0H19DRAFT_1256481 [Mycena capillaripes]
MLSTSFHTRYRLISALSVLLIGSNIATLMLLYFHPVFGKVNQIAPLVFALIAFAIVSRMLSTPRSDPKLSTRRLPSTYNKRICLLLMGEPLEISVIGWVCTTISITLAPRLSRVRASFISPFTTKCIPLGLDVVLPFSIIIALYSTSRAFRRRVSELYSTRLSFLGAAVVGETNTIDDASTEVAIVKPAFFPAWRAEDLLRDLDLLKNLD